MEGSAVPVHAAIWWIVAQQTRALSATCALIEQLRDQHRSHKERFENEVSRLKRVIGALDERVRMLKEAAMKATQCALPTARGGQLDAPPPSQHPHTPTAVDAAATIQLRMKKISDDLRSQNEQLQRKNGEFEVTLSAAARERATLMLKWQTEANAAKDAQQTIAELKAELAALRDANATAKKELREKSAVESEHHVKVWKLEVELNIAQNVMSELRQREKALQQDAFDAAECQRALRETLDRERNQQVLELTRLREDARRSSVEEDVAKQVLRGERQKMADNEKEVERLRALDSQMEVLEQNFANYAACKIAQREAFEEEERLLQACVDAIGKDVFLLPAALDSEEHVRMHLAQLRTAKDTFDAEERTRKRHKALSVNFKEDRSARKQLAVIMQQRYSAIQIFACEQRLSQLAVERRQRDSDSELSELRTRQEALLVELAHAKTQCDLLVQRNSELELTRKEMLRGRGLAEQEIKNLKATIHRMRIANEEQEKVLVDVGTRLQNAKMRQDSVGEPLSSAISAS